MNQMVKNSIPTFIKCDVENSIEELDRMLKIDIFSEEEIKNENPLLKAVFTYILILLRDLLHKTNNYGCLKVNFNEDVKIDGDIKDVCDLIKFMRDAMCHIDSDNHYLEKDIAKAELIILFGKKDFCTYSAKDEIIEVRSLYADDVCFFLGKQKIYLHRHIIRAFNEVKLSFSH